ncbi:MAG: LUD domain-containing protein [Rhizomicrobium sp.]|jgi:L-lactate dehydrogenase complex protein LldG
MSARDEILTNIRTRRVRAATRPGPYKVTALPNETVRQFIDRARASGADVKQLASARDIPTAIAEALRDRNLPAIVHLPPEAQWQALAWDTAPGLTVSRERPGGDDAALNEAPFAIAETGTLAFLSDPARPASWHFRPGLEIAVVRSDAVLPHLESVLAKAKLAGQLPHTINLVTGPSRTGDIEQTLEMGAHGPKALVILVIDGA